MSEEKKKEANEKAKLAMQTIKKRRLENDISENNRQYETTHRKKRKHPITRKNARRVLRFIKETGTYEELINYFNTEKKKWLYMNASGVHYQVASTVGDDNYQIVHLVDKTHMNLINHQCLTDNPF
jgi:hypothetical protein